MLSSDGFFIESPIQRLNNRVSKTSAKYIGNYFAILGSKRAINNT